MPLQPIVDHWRIMSVFQGASGLPEDRLINTFHFRNDNIAGGPEAIADGLKEAVDEFYKGTPTGVLAPLNAYLSAAGIASHEYRVYDLGQPEPRAPIIRAPDPTIRTGADQGPGLPWECAAVLSWGTNVIAPKPKVPGKRGRGRTYLGPLSMAVLDDTKPTNNFIALAARNVFADAMKRLLNHAGFSLVVLSTKYNQTDVVTKGFIDDALDTQRRRGQDATIKTLVTP